jgi:transposase-like protein
MVWWKYFDRNYKVMIKEKCDRCGSSLGTESKKTKQRFCGNCKKKFQLHG